jgi:aminomethyltransferase
MSPPDPTDAAGELLTSPLHERHLALGAKLAAFGGWSMPLEYAGSGVVKEHTAVRTAAGLFDVSHLGKGTVRGPGAAQLVGDTLSNDLGRIHPGKAQYTLCCDDATGGIVDDLIAYLYADDHVFLVPNAANTADVLARLRAAAPSGVEVEDLHRALAVLAVQGPRADDVLDGVGLPTGHEYMSFVEAVLDGVSVVVCRTGYTGERGYELVCPAESAPALWDRLVEAGEPLGMLPCGLGARDTLRTEMGYPLHGQDISLAVTPVQARLGWAVGWGKERFWGKDALVAERERGAERLLRGLRAVRRGIPRPGMQVLSGSTGGPVGEVTSGTFSPTLRTGIALALLDTAVKEGDEVAVDVRGRSEPFTVTRPPFVEAST